MCSVSKACLPDLENDFQIWLAQLPQFSQHNFPRQQQDVNIFSAFCFRQLVKDGGWPIRPGNENAHMTEAQQFLKLAAGQFCDLPERAWDRVVTLDDRPITYNVWNQIFTNSVKKRLENKMTLLLLWYTAFLVVQKRVYRINGLLSIPKLGFSPVDSSLKKI